MIKIEKQLLITEDIAFGFGTVVQKRTSGSSIEDKTYKRVNADSLPALDGNGIETTTQKLLDTVLSLSAGDLRFAQKQGANNVVFRVSSPIDVSDAVPKAYLESFSSVHSSNISNPHQVTKSQIGLENVTNTSDMAKPVSTATQIVLDAKYDKDEYIDVSVGVGSALKPIITNAQGYVDGSLVRVTIYNPRGVWTPEAAKEYPDTNLVPGDMWYIKEVGAGYTFLAGDLLGQTALNDDVLTYGADSWILKSENLEPNTYYLLDGSVAITGAFLGGGQQFKNAAQGTDVTDLITLEQLNVHRDNISNPHSVTALQLGLGNVDNTSDLNKPVSTAIQVELDLKAPLTHLSDSDNPHSVTKDQVGLENVDNTSDINKPISTATQTVLDSKFNIDGSVPMTGNLETPGVIIGGKALSPYHFKNKLVNGDFSVHQEHGIDSIVVDTSNDAYAADLFQSYISSGGQYTITRSTLGYDRSLKYTVNTGQASHTSGAGWWPLYYYFEGQDLYHLQGQNITISFKFKASETGNYPIALINSTGSSIESYVTEFAYTVAGETQKISVTIPIKTSWADNLVNDENKGFVLYIASLQQDTAETTTKDTWLTDAYYTLDTTQDNNWADTAGNYIEIANLQVEAGDVATEFERIPYSEQLLRVQRYFWNIVNDSSSDLWLYFSTGTLDTTEGTYPIFLPTAMRTNTPSLGYSSLSDFYLWATDLPPTSIGFEGMLNNIATLFFGNLSQGSFDVSYVALEDNNGAYLQLDDRL